ncbi:transposase [Streptomyces sp. NPDC059169]|uniref:transposase n=1 Tax=unclassified Streptomyces TaxID=2593676 RepID=UPI0036C0A36B
MKTSSTDCVGAAHECSGTLGGIGLCQDAVHLTYASRCGHVLIERELHLAAGWAGDEERRPLRHVPDEIGFATKPQPAAVMLRRAGPLRHTPGRWFAGDEVYRGPALRRTARSLGFDYALAVTADHRVTSGAGPFTIATLAARGPARSWMRMRTGHGLKGDLHYD